MIDAEFKSQARRIYFTARRSNAGHIQSLRIVLPMLERYVQTSEVQGAVLPTVSEIEEWAIDDAWDLQFDALQSDDFRNNLRQPEDEEDRFRLRLEAAQRQREHTADMLRLVQAEADARDFALSEPYLNKLNAAQRAYTSACREEEKQEDAARRRLLEIPSGPAAAADIQARTQRLMDQYGDLGPQYEILCRRLAELDYRAEMQRASGRDLPTSELVQLNGAVLSTIGQLQKYTESTKSESLSKDRTEIALAIIGIGEKIFLNSAPHQWAAFIEAIKQRLQAADRKEVMLNQAQAPRSVLQLVPTGSDSFGVKEES